MCVRVVLWLQLLSVLNMFRQGKCGICGPLMMTEAEFDKTDWVPDPIEQAGKSEVYECFEKSFGQETNEDKMPSLHVPGSR